ncbi:MAG: hypothetical protein KJ587_07940 [Alphaproteobacteria bacterium]|nr:hypothetical protein [Alphaproteobacteria bacterium]
MKSGLKGPYRLTADGIDAAILEAEKGVFALGHEDYEGRFRIAHVGRSDLDLRKALRELIGTSASFKYLETPNDRETFEAHCELFHKFKPPGNHLHPDRPKGTNWVCPRCMALQNR